MTLIDRHIFSEWLKPFAVSVAVLTGILLIVDLQDDLWDLLSFGITPADILRYYVVLVPSFLPTVLPFALMLSVLFALGSLHRSNEITAMRATGVSMAHIARSLWLAAGLLAVGLFYLNSEVVPTATERSSKLWDAFAFASEREASTDADTGAGIEKNLTFHDRYANRLWFMNRFSRETLSARGITVSELDAADNETARWFANEARYDPQAKLWVFVNGRHMAFDERGQAIRMEFFETREMRQLRTPPDSMYVFRKRPKDLSFFELQEIIAQIEPGDPRGRAYAVRFHRILANPLSCFVVVAIAIPFAVGGVRTNPMIGVAKAFGLLFVFLGLDHTAVVLSERGYLEPVVAAWLPGVLLLTSAWVFTRRFR